VLTVFSSCDYCESGNDAGIAVVTDRNDAVRCTALAPLIGKEIDKRRVIFPDWLMHEREMEAPSVAGKEEVAVEVEIHV
jgi:hypothetical protein